MTNRTIEYKITANAEGYRRGTDQARTATRALTREHSALTQTLQKTGSSLTRIGTRVTAMGAGFAASIGGAVSAANAYDREFSKITGLVGIAADEVERMKGETLNLAGETARAPQELASAMFTIQSAGLRGADGAEALAIAAKGAAGGMGETRDIAQALVGSMNAYASENMTAAETGDILAATVRAGNFEASQLAGSLGNILPIASELEISLADVGGGVALLTRTNGNAAQSITQLSGIMRAFLAPSQQAKEILARYGLTLNDIRNAASGPEGLVGALQMLNNAVGGNSEELARFFGRAEATNAALAILGSSAETLEATFGEVRNATGTLNEAFDAAANTDAFKFEQAMQEVKVAAIELGAAAGPHLAGLISKLGDAARAAGDFFANLSPGVQSVASDLAKLMLVGGPAAIAVGKLVTAFATMNPLVAAAGLALGAFGAIVLSHRAEQAELNAAADRLIEAMRTEGDVAVANVDAFRALTEEIDAMSAATDNAAASIADTVDAFVAEEIIGAGFGDALTDAGLLVKDFVVALDNLSEGTRGFDDLDPLTLRDLVDVNKDDGEAIENFRQQIEKLDPALQGLATKMADAAAAGKITAEDMWNLIGASQRLVEVTDRAAARLDAEAKALIQTNVAQGRLTQGEVDYALANTEATRTTGEYVAALEILQPWLLEARDAVSGWTVENEIAAIAAGGIAGAARQVAADVEDATGAVEDHSEALTTTAELYDAIAGAAEKYAQILDSVNGSQMRLDAAQINTAKNQRALVDALGEGTDMAVDMSDGFDIMNERHVDFIEAARDAAEAIREETIAMAENGAEADDVRRATDRYVESLTDVLRQAGLSEIEIRDLIRTYADVPDEVLTQLLLDTEEARRQLDQWTRTTTFPDIEIVAALDATYALADLGTLAGTGWSTTLYVTADVSAALSELNFLLAELARAADQGIATYGAADTGSIGGGGFTTTAPRSTSYGGSGYGDAGSLGSGYVPGGNDGILGPDDADFLAGFGVFYHDGGVVGRRGDGYRRPAGSTLAADEVPAILQTGERVLSRTDAAWFDQVMLGHGMNYTPTHGAPNGTGSTAARPATQVTFNVQGTSYGAAQTVYGGNVFGGLA